MTNMMNLSCGRISVYNTVIAKKTAIFLRSLCLKTKALNIVTNESSSGLQIELALLPPFRFHLPVSFLQIV